MVTFKNPSDLNSESTKRNLIQIPNIIWAFSHLPGVEAVDRH